MDHWETKGDGPFSPEFYEGLTEKLLTYPQERVLKGFVGGDYGHRNLVIGQSYCIFMTWLLRFMED